MGDSRLRIEYARTARGRQPGLEFLESLDAQEQARMRRLFRRLTCDGRIESYQQFKRVRPGLWEFKAFQARLFGDFRPGGRFVVASGTVKKQDFITVELDVAQRILAEHDARERVCERS